MHLKFGPHLGQGSVGDAWQAEDELGRKLAVKFFNIARNDQDAYAYEMARTLARVTHRCVVGVLALEHHQPPDGGEARPAVIMELVAGEPLDTALSARIPTLEEARSWGRDISDAIAAFHAAEVVHGDLHAGNIIVTPHAARIIDPFYKCTLEGLTPRKKASTLLDDLVGLSRILRTILLRVGCDVPSSLEEHAVVSSIDSGVLLDRYLSALPNADGPNAPGKRIVEMTVIGGPPIGLPSPIKFGSATVLRGANGTGKTACCEWLTAALTEEKFERWSTGSKVHLAIRRADGQSAEAILSGGIVTHRNEGHVSTHNPFNNAVVFLRSLSIRSGMSVNEWISKRLGVDRDTIIKLVPFLRKNPSSLVSEGVYAKRQFLIGLGDGKPLLPFKLLSGSEKTLVLIEFAITLALRESQHRPCLLLIDGLEVLDIHYTEKLLQRLRLFADDFQSVVIEPHRKADLREWVINDFGRS